MANVDVDKAVELRTRHALSYTEIAAIQGVTRQAIQQRLSTILPDKEEIEAFKTSRADILAHAQYRALIAWLSLSEVEQKEMIQRRGMVDMGICYDKERLERDLSTANLASVTGDLAEIKKLKLSTGK